MMVKMTSKKLFASHMWPVRPLNSASTTRFCGKNFFYSFSTIDRGAAQHVFFNFVDSGISTTSSFV